MNLSYLLILIILLTLDFKCIYTSKSNYSLSIIHFNDFHARYEPVTNISTTCKNQHCIGGFSRLYFSIKKLLKERPNPILLNAGDNFKGTIWYNVHKWNVTQHFLNKLPLDAITLGNHEFDDGISGLIPFLKNIQAPVLVSNINANQEQRIQNLYNKSIVIEKKGKKIGIIGVITTTTSLVSKTENLIFEEESPSVNTEARRLEEEDNVFTNIVLSHCGYETDLKIAKNSSSKISLIVGGHTDTFLYTGTPTPGPDIPSGPYPTVVLNKKGAKVLIVQASAYTKYLGDLTVVYDDVGNIINWSGAPIFLEESLSTDEDIDEEIKVWKKAVDLEGAKIVGMTLNSMPNKPCRSEECLLGNFATDAMIASYLRSLNQRVEKYPVIAMIHAGGMRAGIEKGNISFNQLTSTFPFEDTIDVFDIKGENLKSIFESHIDDNHLKYPHLLQISGLKIILNISKTENERVQSLKYFCKNCNNTYEDILDQDYKILLPTFLSSSGFNPLFKQCLKNKKVVERDLNVYTKYLEENWPLDQKIEERIQIVR